MRILGIDPGTATTGFGIIDITTGGPKFVTAGVIRTPKTDQMTERLKTIHLELDRLVGDYKPDQIAVELLYFAANSTTAMSVGQARGVILLVAGQRRMSVSEYTPLQVKLAVSGYGKADKNQVQVMVAKLLELSDLPRPDDAADGLAIALTHYATVGNREKSSV